MIHGSNIICLIIYNAWSSGGIIVFSPPYLFPPSNALHFDVFVFQLCFVGEMTAGEDRKTFAQKNNMMKLALFH